MQRSFVHANYPHRHEFGYLRGAKCRPGRNSDRRVRDFNTTPRRNKSCLRLGVCLVQPSVAGQMVLSQKQPSRIRHAIRLIAVATVPALIVVAIWIRIGSHAGSVMDPGIAETAARASPEVSLLIRESSHIATELREQFPDTLKSWTSRPAAPTVRQDRACHRALEASFENRLAIIRACEKIASTALEKGDLAEAETYFRKALELDPDSVSLPAQLGETLLNPGSAPAAIKSWRPTADGIRMPSPPSLCSARRTSKPSSTPR